MIHGNDPAEYRRFFQEAWRKYREGADLEPMESLVAKIIGLHPEYHNLLESPQIADREFTTLTEENPFLHLGLHVALHEQLAADRPTGIRALHQRLVRRQGDPHDAEHRMTECLAEALWEAQRGGCEPDETVYLERLRRL